MSLESKIKFLNQYLETATAISKFNSLHPIKIGIEEKDNFLEFTEYDEDANSELQDETEIYK